MSTDFTGDATPIASNLEQVDTDGFAGIGSAMTESSGIFTFPTTGIWLITFAMQHAGTADASTGTYFQIQVAEDAGSGDSYGTAASGLVSVVSSGLSIGSISYMFDVTSVTTHKVRFRMAGVVSTNTTKGGTNENETHMTFLRLGDT